MSTVAERLRAVVAEAQTITVKGILGPDETTRVEGLLAEGHALKAQIEQAERLGELTDYAGKSAGMLPMAGMPLVLSGGQAGEATVETARDERSGLSSVKLLQDYGEGIYNPRLQATTGTKAYRDSFRNYIQHGKDVGPTHMKTLQDASDASGGFLVPTDMADRIISRAPTPTRVASKVTQLTTSRDQLGIPRVNYSLDDNYTTGIRVTWTGETPASSTAMRVTDPVFGMTNIPVFTAMLSIPLTNDLIEDSQFPVISYITGKFAETVDLLRDNMILNGTGIGQPTGILANIGGDTNVSPAYVASTNASALTADGIVRLATALPEQYDDNATFIFNKTNTMQAIALLKDAQNRYLFGVGYQDSGLSPSLRNRQLLGYDVTLSGFMPNIAPNAFPIIFGDPRGYYLVNRVTFSIQVLRELYAETNQILLVGRLRFGGQVAEGFRLKVGKVSVS